MTVFGTIKTEADLEEAAIQHLMNWLPTYMAEVERQHSLAPQAMPSIKSFTTRNELQNWPEDQLPSCVVVSPGTGAAPRKDGRGQYRVDYVLGIAVVVSADNKPNTNRLAKLYSGAVNAAVLQNPSLGGFAMGVKWEGAQNNDLPEQRGRTLAASQLLYTVTVEDVVTALAGPAVPGEDPYTAPDDWPSIETAVVTVTKEAA